MLLWHQTNATRTLVCCSLITCIILTFLSVVRVILLTHCIDWLLLQTFYTKKRILECPPARQERCLFMFSPAALREVTDVSTTETLPLAIICYPPRFLNTICICVSLPPPNNPCKGVGQAGWTLSALVAIDALVIRNNVWEWTPNTVYTYISTARSGIRTHASPWDFNLNTVMFNFGDLNNSTHLPSSYNFISLYCML